MTQRTKIVVRHLPYALPEAIFWRSVAAWVDDAPAGSILSKTYIPGKNRQRSNKYNIPSRAYIHFATVEQVVDFHRNFDEHSFKDSKGVLYNARVEFAPYQKTSRPPKKVDPRQGTIDDDPEYLTFVENLATKEPPANIEAPVLRPEQPVTTPLIEHLRAQRQAAKAAEAQRKANEKQKKQTEAERKSVEVSKPGGRSQGKKEASEMPVPQIIKRKTNKPSSSTAETVQPNFKTAAATTTTASTTTTSKPPKPKSGKRDKTLAGSPTPVVSKAPTPTANENSASSKPPGPPATSVEGATSSGSSNRGGRGRGRGRGGHGAGRGVGGLGGVEASSTTKVPTPSPAPHPPAPSASAPSHTAPDDAPSRPRRAARTDADQAGARRRLGAALAGLGVGGAASGSTERTRKARVATSSASATESKQP